MILPAEDSPQLPVPTCPRCGRDAENSYAHEDKGIVDAGYVCDREHLWTVRYVAGGAA